MERTIDNKKSIFTTKELTFTALMAVLIIVCSWISIPTTVPFTLQTFAIFFSLVLLGGKCSTFSVLTFLLLGAVGLPVFSGFNGGVGALFGLTGGYMLGFLFTTTIFWASELVFKNGWKRIIRSIFSMLIGLAVCYLFGTFWFMHVYALDNNVISFSGALMVCVIPYLGFDLLKMAVAVILGERLRKLVF